ncbi:MAG: response regulator transcription factor [Bacteriovorax sp.]|nr:response regulator transcription factor [Bacteriovorax sp.]
MTIIKGPTFKICILSERHNFKNILAGKLRMENFDVEFADGGFHLLHLLERFKDEFNMIIFNEDMSDMPAFEIISMIRQTKSKSELPILFISKNDNEEEIYEMVLNGANEYVVQSANYKPIVERAQKYSLLNQKNAA